MFSDCWKTMIERSANGSVSGSDSRIVIGCSHDSNCAARIRYMKISDKAKARMKFCAARPSSRDRPVSPPRYSGPALRSRNCGLHGVLHFSLRSAGQQVGEDGDLPLAPQPVDVGWRRAG